jgi:predicted DNA-binding protein (MmcQ/YjbR family)
MFSDGDLGLAELREIALGFPGAFEKISHGRPSFFVTKMFAMYGGSSKTVVPGEMTRFSHSLLVKVDETERSALAQDTRFFFPAYLGPAGWLGLDFTAAKIDWAEVTELVDASYRLVAPKKLLNQLDDQGAS